MEKALLTGGNGNLGRHVADRLLDAGVPVVKFDLPGTEPDAARPGEVIVTGDIRDSGLVADILRQHKPDVIYHLASLLSGGSEDDLAAAWQINATASFDLMRLAMEFEVERLFFASTGASYGPGLGDPLPEDAEQWPENLYGATKVAVERLGVYFKIKHGLDFRCLRFPLVVSPFAPKAAVTAYPSHAFKAAVAGEPFVFPVSSGVGMSAMFFEDVIDGIVKFTLADRAQVRRHAYNLHAYFVSAEMVAEQILQHVPTFQFSYQPVAAVEALMTAWPDVIADQSARNHWGWDPKFDFARSATRMFELLRGN